jgi:hypothetical protein
MTYGLVEINSTSNKSEGDLGGGGRHIFPPGYKRGRLRPRSVGPVLKMDWILAGPGIDDSSCVIKTGPE